MTSVILKRCLRCPDMERISFLTEAANPTLHFIINYMYLRKTPVDLWGSKGIHVISLKDTFVR